MNDITVPDVRAVEAQGSQVYKRIADIQIKNQDDFSLVGKMLVEVKRVANKIKDEFQPAVEAANKAHKQTVALRDKALAAFDAAEELAKEKMRVYRESTPDAEEENISFRRRFDFVVDDLSSVGREFMVPDIKSISGLVNSCGKDAEKIVGGIRVTERLSVAVKS